MPVTPAARPNLLSHGAATQRLGVHPNALTHWVKRGWLAAVHEPNGATRFREQDVAALRDEIYAG